MRRIGVLAAGMSAAEEQQWGQLFLLDLLRRAGFEEGRNLSVEWRYAEGDTARLPALAEELVRLNVEVIIASFNNPIAAAKAATRSIPVVMLNALSPVEQGFVQSLAHPGGNVTGMAWSAPETVGKILQVLKEAAPGLTRVAVLGNPAVTGGESYGVAGDRAAGTLGLSIQHFAATRPEEIAPALERIGASRAQALFAAFDTVLLAGMRDVAAFALRKKLLSISTASRFVDAGGLLYYGPDFKELAARTVSYVVRILGGAKPADLPVELPSKYELIINLKTARAIGHKIPPTLLARADRVIE